MISMRWYTSLLLGTFACYLSSTGSFAFITIRGPMHARFRASTTTCSSTKSVAPPRSSSWTRTSKIHHEGEHGLSSVHGDGDTIYSTLTLRELFKLSKEDMGLVSIAREFAERKIAERRVSSVKEAHAAISIFKLSGGTSNLHLESAIGVIDYMESMSLKPDTLIFNNLLDMCAKGSATSGTSNIDVALELLDRMERMHIDKDVASFTSAIQTCAQALKWREAINLLQRMMASGIEPDTISLSSIIQGCTLAGRWREAMSILLLMRSSGIPLDTIACNSVISACARAGEWSGTLKVMEIMAEENLKFDSYTYTSAIMACDRTERFDKAKVLKLVDDMISFSPSYTTSSSSSSTLSPRSSSKLSAAPFNAAITSLLRHSKTEEALLVYHKMLALGVASSDKVVTSLITGLAKLGVWNTVLDIYHEIATPTTFAEDGDERSKQKEEQVVPISISIPIPIPLNEAVLGSVLRACEKLGRCADARQVFNKLQSLLALENRLVPVAYYNMLISSYGREASFNETFHIMTEMQKAGVSLNAETYTSLIASCKQQGRLTEALSLLKAYEETPEIYDRKNSYPYAAATSVCVATKAWEQALDILEKLEQMNVAPSKVAYNSAIEALDAAGEAVRAELVYQSGMRSGVYSHWVKSSNPAIDMELEVASDGPNVGLIDLHYFPAAVGRSAIMHALGEMWSKNVTIADPLYIITGRGNRQDPRERGGVRLSRGVLISEIRSFLMGLGIEITPQGNPGRIKITKYSLEKWFTSQQDDDAIKRKSGKAHGNLFLKLANAISAGRKANVKKVCPFSDASIISEPPLTTTTTTTTTMKKGSCPAHAALQQSLEVEAPLTTTTTTTPTMKKGSCPAHAAPQQSLEAERPF